VPDRRAGQPLGERLTPVRAQRGQRFDGRAHEDSRQHPGARAGAVTPPDLHGVLHEFRAVIRRAAPRRVRPFDLVVRRQPS
jgi:hypothetical protein